MNNLMPPLPSLSHVFGKTGVAKFYGGLLAADDGILVLREVEQRLLVGGRLAACMADPRAPGLIIHTPPDIVRSNGGRSMRFVSYLVSLTLIVLYSTGAMGQTVEPGQKDGTAKERADSDAKCNPLGRSGSPRGCTSGRNSGSAIWKGVFADGTTALTQEKLEELLASHQAWVRTANQKLEEEWRKAKVKQSWGTRT